MKLMQILREPLVHFLFLGAVIFIISGLLRNPEADKPDRIVVTAGHVEQIIEGWSLTWQRPPAPQELEWLIEDYIREEVLYREALVLGLDRDDTIVRHRLRQKVEFLSEDMMGVRSLVKRISEDFLNYVRRDFESGRSLHSAISILIGIAGEAPCRAMPIFSGLCL